jgi:hypothetical protein
LRLKNSPVNTSAPPKFDAELPASFMRVTAKLVPLTSKTAEADNGTLPTEVPDKLTHFPVPVYVVQNEALATDQENGTRAVTAKSKREAFIGSSL